MSKKQNPLIQAYKSLEPGDKFQVTANLKTERFEKVTDAWARCIHSEAANRIGQICPMLATETVEVTTQEDEE